MDEVYRFESNHPTPFILDCGANWGLSIIYFKRLYPQARILAFEPDQHIFKLLEHNVNACAFSDVTIRREAVWTEDTTLYFSSDFSLGGHNVTDPPISQARK